MFKRNEMSVSGSMTTKTVRKQLTIYIKIIKRKTSHFLSQ